MTTYILLLIMLLILILLIGYCIIQHIKTLKLIKEDTNNVTKLNYVDRMNIEHKHLVNKINKLEDFLNTTNSSNIINPYQRNMLNKQLSYMKGYANILNIRIEYENNINKVKKDKTNN